MRLSRLCTTLALASLSLTAAAERDFSPAVFGDEENSLGKLIEFPELRGDTSVMILCAGIVTSRGKFDGHGCYQRQPGDEAFARQVYAAIRKARLIPASIDGKSVDVAFQYRIRFVQKDEQQSLTLLANTGYEENVEAYGDEHVGAQRVIRKGSWQKACPRQNQFVVLARANVDWDGSPGAVSITHANGLPITAKCETALQDYLLGSDFIPAHAEGEAVPSTYAEPFGS